MATAAVLVSVILAATGPQDFPAAIDTTAAALGDQAQKRFTFNHRLLQLCDSLYQNTDDYSIYSYRNGLEDADFQVLAFFLARNTVTRRLRILRSPIKHAGAVALGEALKNHSTVHILSTKSSVRPSWSAPWPPFSSACIERMTERMNPHRPLRRSMKVETLNKQLFGEWNAFLVPGYDDVDDEQAPKRPSRPRTATAASTAAQTEDAGTPTELQPAPFPDVIDAANDVHRELENQFELGDSEGTADDAGEGGVQGSAVAPAVEPGVPAPAAGSPTTTSPSAAMDHSWVVSGVTSTGVGRVAQAAHAVGSR